MMRNPKRALSAALTVAAVAALTVGCAATAEGPAEADAEFTMAIAAGPQGWDPYKCVGSTRTVLTSVYDTLARITPDGTSVPSLANAWEYESPTRFVLTLRDDVAFADGTPVDADVVKANLDRAASSPTAVTAQFAADKPTITAVSPTEVAIDLAQPDPDLPYLFSDCGGMIVHPDLIADPERMTTEVDGTGPYTYDTAASITDSSYVFIKKDEYWDSAAYPFAKATFSVIPDGNAMLSALLSGQVDISVAGSYQAVPQIESAGKAYLDGNVSQFSVILSDRAGELVPALADERVRQALNYAIDRDAIIETLFGERGLPTPQLLPEGSAGYEAALNDRYPYDPEKATELLEAAGYADGFTLPVLTTGVLQFDTFLSTVADYWSKVGVQVEQNVVDTPTYLSAKFTREYPAFVEPLTVVPPYSSMNRYFGPTSAYNPFGATDPTLTADLAAAAAGDAEALGAASTRLLDLGWYVGAGFNAQYIFYDPDVVSNLEMLNSANQPLFYDWRPAGS
jgi:peptide/nickel transport system substrate-binding protein